jgi:hypothetical protein
MKREEEEQFQSWEKRNSWKEEFKFPSLQTPGPNNAIGPD